MAARAGQRTGGVSGSVPSAARFDIIVAERRLAIDGDGSIERFRPAFARVAEGATGRADASLFVRTHPDWSCEPPSGAPASGLNRGADGSFVAVGTSPASVEAWIPGASPRLTVDLSPEALQSGDRLAQPAHAAIGGWISANGQFLMHAAGVALGERGVLLLGPGGRGKTTTALACAAGGLSYLGDDLCIAAPDLSGRGRHMLHGLYGTAKLNADSLARLDAGDWDVLGTTPRGKTVVMLPAASGFSRSCRLAAIVGVVPMGAAPYEPLSISQTMALRWLAQASAPGIGAHGPSASWLAGLSRLARDVPMFSLGLGWDLPRLVGVVSDLCKDGPSARQEA